MTYSLKNKILNTLAMKRPEKSVRNTRSEGYVTMSDFIIDYKAAAAKLRDMINKEGSSYIFTYRKYRCFIKRDPETLTLYGGIILPPGNNLTKQFITGTRSVLGLKLNIFEARYYNSKPNDDDDRRYFQIYNHVVGERDLTNVFVNEIFVEIDYTPSYPYYRIYEQIKGEYVMLCYNLRAGKDSIKQIFPSKMFKMNIPWLRRFYNEYSWSGDVIIYFNMDLIKVIIEYVVRVYELFHTRQYKDELTEKTGNIIPVNVFIPAFPMSTDMLINRLSTL